jgi:hypothetical protein
MMNVQDLKLACQNAERDLDAICTLQKDQVEEARLECRRCLERLEAFETRWTVAEYKDGVADGVADAVSEPSEHDSDLDSVSEASEPVTEVSERTTVMSEIRCGVVTCLLAFLFLVTLRFYSIYP